MKNITSVRRSLLCLLCLILCFSGTVSFAEKAIEYTDVPADYWATPYIQNMSERGIVSGYGDGTFGPENSVLRCEYAKMLTGVAKIPVSNVNTTPYADVDTNQWYAPYVKATQEYITGYSTDNTFYFDPDAPASREDVTVALMKVLGDDLSEYYYIDNLLEGTFWDLDTISPHNRPYVAAAVDRGYITGHQDGSFRGQAPIIRAEISAILCRAFPEKADEENVQEPIQKPEEDKSNSTILPSGVKPNKDGVLRTFFLDVGQADAEFVELPNGKTLLIDAGTAQSGDEILKFIKNLGYTKLDYVVATHPHADHIGGMAKILKGIEVGNMYMPYAETTTKTYEELLQTIVDLKINVIAVKPGVRLVEDGNLLAYFIAPNSDEYDDLNEYSAVIKMIYGETSFLFTGDASSKSEKEMLAAAYDLTANVIKIGHHGAKTSSSEEFIKTVKPQYAVISCGKDNSYGHPHEQTLKTLMAENVKVYRTDKDGTICISSDGEKIITE